MAVPTISVTSGSGYVGSTYTATDWGQWYSDGNPISGETGEDFVMTTEYEGTNITNVNGEGASNGIQLWMPEMASTTLIEWWDIFDTDNISLVGSDIDAWTGRANGTVASAAGASNRPEYEATGLNGLPCATGDGSATKLSFTPTGFPTGSVALDFGVVASKPDNGGNNVFDWGDTANGERRAMSVSGSTSDIGFFGFGGGYDFKSGDGWAPDTRFVCISLAAESGGTQVIFIRSDGNSLGDSTVNALQTGLTHGYIMGGADGGGAGSWDGKAQSFIVYEGGLTTDDRQRLEGFMAHRFGLTASLDGGHPYKTDAPEAVSTPPQAAQVALMVMGQMSSTPSIAQAAIMLMGRRRGRRVVTTFDTLYKGTS